MDSPISIFMTITSLCNFLFKRVVFRYCSKHNAFIRVQKPCCPTACLSSLSSGNAFSRNGVISLYIDLLRTYILNHIKNKPRFKEVLITKVANVTSINEKDNLSTKFENFVNGKTSNPRADFIDLLLRTIDQMKVIDGHGPSAVDVLNDKHWKGITTWKDLLIDTMRFDSEFLPVEIKQNIREHDHLRKQIVLLFKTMLSYCSHESPEQFLVNMKIMIWLLTDDRSFKDILLKHRVLFPK